jgi:hypothetical protein
MLSTENSTDRPVPRATPLLTCGRCGSIAIEPIASIATVPLREAIETAWTDWRAGRRVQSLRFGLRWTCVAMANALSEPYRCTDCGLGFVEARP